MKLQLHSRLRSWLADWRRRQAWPLDRRFIWLRSPPPLAGRKVCLLACFSADGRLSRHTLFLSESWRSNGFDVILIVATEQPERFVFDRQALAGLAGVALRRNSGYDFGSWASVIRARPDVRRAGLLALANDSLYGPLAGFDRLLARVEQSSADVVAMTDSHEITHHIQSYLVFYKRGALSSAAFRRFWKRVCGGDREATIQHAELPQLAFLRRGGLRLDVLFPSVPGVPTNPTLLQWRELIEAGFPFVKVQLLRDNPKQADIAAWDDVLRARGYEPSIVREHLGARYAASAASVAASGAFRAPVVSTPLADGV